MPFSQSRLSNQYFLLAKMAASYFFYFSLSILGSWDSFTTWAWARDLHRRCIYYLEHVYTWEGYSNRSVSYPEHVYTWEGYSNHSISLCVCLSVCVSPLNS